MLSNRLIKAPLLWCLPACLMLTGVVWPLGQRLSGIELAPDQGASWYYWKLPHPTVWTHLSAWLGYVAHQLTVLGLIFYAQHHVRHYTACLHRVNIIALAANLGFIVLRPDRWARRPGLLKPAAPARLGTVAGHRSSVRRGDLKLPRPGLWRKPPSRATYERSPGGGDRRGRAPGSHSRPVPSGPPRDSWSVLPPDSLQPACVE